MLLDLLRSLEDVHGVGESFDESLSVSAQGIRVPAGTTDPGEFAEF